MLDIELIEQATFMYLQSLSLNSVSRILSSWLGESVLPKKVILKHIEQYCGRIPNQLEITRWLSPVRSGYYALDGTWLKYRGKDIVLLILLDVKTLDIVNWKVSLREDAEAYHKLIESVINEFKLNLKGFHCDGDPGLFKTLKELLPKTPIQLCVFHKYFRAGQVIPFVRIKNDTDRKIKKLTEQVLFANSKQEAITSLNKLKRYAQEHQQNEKLKKLIGVLKRNFNLLLTHFDHLDMSPYNNVLEGFNYLIKKRIRLMKGFKKSVNVNKWLKLILTDWRFHYLTESTFLS